MGGAAHQLATALGISEEEAKTLAADGMNDIPAILTAAASDIDGSLGCGLEKAEAILTAARSQVAEKGAPAAL